MGSTLPANLVRDAKGLLTQEIQLYKTLRTMVSREQEAIVLNEDMEELLQILQEKDGVIARLQLLADSWGDLLGSAGIAGPDSTEGFWERFRALFPDDHEVSAMLDEARDAAEDLMKAEDESKRLLERYSAGLREQLASMAKGRSVAASYERMGGAFQ